MNMHFKRMLKFLNVVMLGILLSACGGKLPEDTGSLQQIPATPLPAASEQALTVQFLGAGGIYLRLGDQALLGDPFFSNPPLLSWLLDRELRVKENIIDAHLPPLANMQGILVGHAHFDHALDVPYIAGKLPENVKIFGSESIPNLLAAQLSAERLVDLTPHMVQNGQGGEWVYLNPRLRILPIYSEHAPHVGDIVFASQHVTTPRSESPRTTFDWQSGTNLNYVIDFLGDDQQVRYRLFYQSSASDESLGYPPQWLLDDTVPFDLALLCAANFNHVSGYPQSILSRLQPRQVMLIHWEQFWDNYSTTKASPLPGLDFAALESRIRSVLDTSVPVWLPMRGAHLQLEP